MKPKLCNFPGKLLHPFSSSWFLLLLERLSLHAHPHLIGICFPSLWSPPFPLHAPARIPTSPAKVRLLLTLTLSHLTIWCFGQTALPFSCGNCGSRMLVNCSLCGTEATLCFSTGLVCSSFSAKACAILQALCWSPSTNKSATSLLFFYLILALSSPLSFLLP